MDGEVLVMLCVIFACFSVFLIDSANLWHLQQLVSYLLMSCCRSQSLQEFPKYSDWKKPRGIMSQTFAEFVERLPSSKAWQALEYIFSIPSLVKKNRTIASKHRSFSVLSVLQPKCREPYIPDKKLCNSFMEKKVLLTYTELCGE